MTTVAVVPLAVLYSYVQRFFISTSRELKRLDAVARSPVFTQFAETVQGLPTIRAFKLSGACGGGGDSAGAAVTLSFLVCGGRSSVEPDPWPLSLPSVWGGMLTHSSEGLPLPIPIFLPSSSLHLFSLGHALRALHRARVFAGGWLQPLLVGHPDRKPM